jgi:hypothetical protein
MAAETAPLPGVKEYIDDHVHDPGLSVATAAAGLHVSERTLYRLFAGEDQTVASYIRSARLRRVKRDLDAAEGARSIRDVAVRWGFTRMWAQEIPLLIALRPWVGRQLRGIGAIRGMDVKCRCWRSIPGVSTGLPHLPQVISMTEQQALCRCGHSYRVHQHYRAGSDCSSCECVRFRRARLVQLLRRWMPI